MALDITSLIAAGLAYLMWKGGGKAKPGEPAPSPAKAPWPVATTAPAPAVAPTPSHAYSPPAPRPEVITQTNPDVPLMQKGIPGVRTFAQAAVEQLKREQAAKEFGSGSGTGTRHYDYKPSKHVTTQQRERAQYLTKDPEWRSGRTIHDADDPSILYVQKRHYSKSGAPLKAVEVWTSDY